MSSRRIAGISVGPRRRHTEASVVGPSVGTQLLDSVDRAVETRWSAAQDRAALLTGTRDERVDLVTARIRRELGAAGAAAGGTAAVPGVGVATVSAAFMCELGWATMRLADLILTIAVIHGHDRAGLQERRMWVLSILSHRDGATDVVAKLAGQFAEAPGRRGVRRLSARSLRQINTALGKSVITKYGSRRGVAALGRMVPFGVGAALGYGMNARAVTMTARHAHGFFSEFPIAMTAIDVEAY